MRLLEQCLNIIVQQATPRLRATMSQPKRLSYQWNIKGLQIHCCSLVSKLVTIAFSVLQRPHEIYLVKSLVSRKGPRVGAAAQMAIAPVLDFKLSSGSGLRLRSPAAFSKKVFYFFVNWCTLRVRKFI